MPMFCPMCGGPARFVDIQIDTQSIRCRFCNAEYSAAQLLNEEGRREEPRKRREISLPRPASITIEADPLKLKITRKLPTAEGYAFVGFGVFWSILTLNTLASGGILTLLFLGAGAYLIGHGVYNIVNSTTFHVKRDTMDITHHPLPGINKSFNMKGVEQLFVKQHVTTTYSKQGSRTIVTYSLNKVTQRGEFVIVQRHLHQDEALYIEQEIERWLKIENLPVRGEFGRESFA